MVNHPSSLHKASTVISCMILHSSSPGLSHTSWHKAVCSSFSLSCAVHLLLHQCSLMFTTPTLLACCRQLRSYAQGMGLSTGPEGGQAITSSGARTSLSPSSSSSFPSTSPVISKDTSRAFRRALTAAFFANAARRQPDGSYR